MFSLFKKIVNNNGENKPIEFEFNGEIKFILKIGDLIIGCLSIEEKQWVFRYSDEFRAQEMKRHYYEDLEEDPCLPPIF